MTDEASAAPGPGPGRVEIESLDHLDLALRHAPTLSGLRLQDLDLTGHEDQLLGRDDLEGMVVLGGRLTPELDAHLRAHHALVFPTDPHAPINPYRATLYQPHELYEGLRERGYPGTPDSLAYEWSRDATLTHDALVTLLRAIHDDSMTDALTEFIADADVVGVMGGHALTRDSDGYAAAAHLGNRLAAAGLLVATGGGPGAMEAANLGALAPSQEALTHAITRLRAIPSFRPDTGAWATVALEVYDDLVRLPVRDRLIRSVGIPTWFYGHEPPNVFCNGIGKYFSNAIREDGLLARCTAGLVVLPGAAGTVQEIFQAATRLYYQEAAAVPRMVLVGRRHWTEQVPVWQALVALAEGRPMAERIVLVDTVDDVPAVVGA